MVASTAIPDGWSGEDIRFSLEVASGASVEINGIVDPSTINITGGEKGGEGVPLGNGGRAWKQTPQGDLTVEFEGYSVGIASDTGNAVLGLQQFFDGQTLDTTEALLSNNTRTQKLYRVSMLKTEDYSASGSAATSAISGGKSAERFSVANARMTKFEHTYGDFIWKYSVAFTIPPFKKAGTANVQWESSDGSETTTGLPALAAYTTTTNF